LCQYENPPYIIGTSLELEVENYRKYLKAMSLIFEKYQDQAAKVAIEDTINFSEKIAPFLNP
jgi:hypothetical protein|tara:strand:+ start:303 stop:488 length:186 start_codon:yes stop_codon:yes gene_type:complete